MRLEIVIFATFLFFPKKMDNIFLPTKKKVEKKKCGRPTGFNFSHPLYGKQNFFCGQPYDYDSNPVELTNLRCVVQTRSGHPSTWASSSVSSVLESTAVSAPTSVKSSHSASTSGTTPSSRLVKYIYVEAQGMTNRFQTWLPTGQP